MSVDGNICPDPVQRLSPLTAADSGDVVAAEAPGNLPLDADFLLGQDLDFSDPDHDGRILGLERFSGLQLTFSQRVSASGRLVWWLPR